MIKKLFLMIIILLGLISCAPSESTIIETTKKIELNKPINLGNYKVSTMEDIITVIFFSKFSKESNLESISEIKEKLVWKVEKNNKDKYIISVCYKNNFLYIPIRIDGNEIHSDFGGIFERTGNYEFAIGSMLPVILTYLYTPENLPYFK